MDAVSGRAIELEVLERYAASPDLARQRAEKARAAQQTAEFYAKARHFVDVWQTFAAQLNDGKTVNAKLAKQVAKAFHDLEKTEGWPAGHEK